MTKAIIYAALTFMAAGATLTLIGGFLAWDLMWFTRPGVDHVVGRMFVAILSVLAAYFVVGFKAVRDMR